MRAAFGLGWTPSELWAATLQELELAVALRFEMAEAQAKAGAAPMDDADMRGFYDRLRAPDA